MFVAWLSPCPHGMAQMLSFGGSCICDCIKAREDEPLKLLRPIGAEVLQVWVYSSV